jgi:glutathione S-transferase
MIKLYQFAPAWNVSNLSPFCLKVETYLKMAGLQYEVVHSNPLQAPKVQLPFIEDNGKRIGDSQFIIEYLKETYGDGVDAHLTPPERAVSNAMQRLIENHLAWAFVHARFGKRDQNWEENKRALFGKLPPVVRQIVPAHKAARHARQATARLSPCARLLGRGARRWRAACADSSRGRSGGTPHR